MEFQDKWFLDYIDRPAMTSHSGHSGATVPYRIRLRTLDNKSVLLGGFLPPDSTLRTLADEIVRLGHAEAGSFSIVFPPLSNRPPATYVPDAFDKSLETCGLFVGHLTIALENFARPPIAMPSPASTVAANGQKSIWAYDEEEETRLALLMSMQQDQAPQHEKAANWSPPPPLVRGVCPRGRIDAKKENLQILHEQFPWIPGQESIRPNPHQLEAKHASQREIDTLFESYLDFVLIEIFGFPVVAGGHRRKADCSNHAALPLTVFKPNKFPYAVPEGTNHYIWWTRESMFQTPQRVTRCIEAALQDLQPNAVHNIVWYENPKMTIPEVYHVQVFWSKVQ